MQLLDVLLQDLLRPAIVAVDNGADLAVDSMRGFVRTFLCCVTE
jgi:hypothetical protein